jgi:SAM-dependent methyltransferase
MQQKSHYFQLPENVPVYIGRQEFVIAYAAGKNVLHLGCVDEGMIEEKQQKGLWLHERIAKVANTVWGVDIDAAGLQLMQSQGYPNLYLSDIENLAEIPEIFQPRFDLILLTEVLEHLDNPGKFLANIRPLFKEGTELLVTVPNATSLSNILENLKGSELVHPDHNYWFSYRTVQSLFYKFGFDLVCIGVYCQYDYHRSLKNNFFHRVLRFLGIHETGGKSAAPIQASSSAVPARKPKVRAWIKVNMTTILYRLLLGKRPFFADGLILIARLQQPE